MRTLITLAFAASLFLAGRAHAQATGGFDPGSGRKVAITAPVTPRLTYSQIQALEQAASVPKTTPGLTPVDPRSVGLRTQAELDTAIRKMFRLSTSRRFRVVWEPGQREISVIVEPNTTSEGL